MNGFQKSFLKGVTVPEVTDETWRLMLEHSQTRQMVIDYIVATNQYCERHAPTWLSWNVKAYPDMDFDGFKAWVETEGDNISDEVWKLALEKDIAQKLWVEAEDSNLYQWGIEGARNSLLDCDTYRCSRFNSESFTWEGGFYGRNGGHFCLTGFQGLAFPKYYDDFEGWVTDLSDDTLRKLFFAVLEFDDGLKKEKIEEEVKYQAFWQMANVIESTMEQRHVGKYEIVEAGEYHGEKMFRVKIKGTDQESMLGSMEQCKRIVEAAEQGKLLGSFAV